MTTATTDPWAEVKRKAAEQRAANAEPGRPPKTDVDSTSVSDSPSNEAERMAEPKPEIPPEWRPAPSRGRGSHRPRVSAREKLRIGQAHEAQARAEGRRVPTFPGETPKAKFVKTNEGINVQTRGPLVLIREPDSPSWFVFRLPGTERVQWDASLDDVLAMIGGEPSISGPWDRISTARTQARILVRDAGGELGS